VTEEEAEALVRTMIERDPATEDVVKAMRSVGRTWSKITQCFGRHMRKLGMDLPDWMSGSP
jgi:hypothetical protein